MILPLQRYGNSLAGIISPVVPMISRASASFTSLYDFLYASPGIGSLKKTKSGFSIEPHGTVQKSVSN